MNRAGPQEPLIRQSRQSRAVFADQKQDQRERDCPKANSIFHYSSRWNGERDPSIPAAAASCHRPDVRPLQSSYRVIIVMLSSLAWLRNRLVSAPYRDTRVVGQDLSRSISTGNFPYLIIGITPDWIRCFWQGTFRHPNRNGNIRADNLHVFLCVSDSRWRVLWIGTYCCDCRQRDDWNKRQTQKAGTD